MAGSRCVYCDPPNSGSIRAGRIAATVTILVVVLSIWWVVSLQPLLELFKSYRKRVQKPKGPSDITILQPIGECDEDRDETQPGSKCLSVTGRKFLVRQAGQLKEKVQKLDEKRKEAKNEVIIIVGILKIIITFYQVTSSFWTSFMVPWPQSLGQVMQYSSVVNLDIFTMQAIACLLQDWDRVSKQLFYTITPALVVVLLALPVLVARVVFAEHRMLKSTEFRILEAKFYNWFVWFLFLIYPICSIAVLDVLHCKRVGKSWYLASDLRVICPLFNEGAFLFSWTMICAIGYPFGIPLIMLLSLRHLGVHKMAREKTERKALNAMLLKFQEDHRQSLLEEKGVDVTICSLLLSILERIHGNFDKVFEAFHPDCHGYISEDKLYEVLLTTLHSCGLKYDPEQLKEDATGVLAYYDTNGDGVLSRLEFCSLACALCPSRHEDLTDRQIQALISHRWGCREGIQHSRRGSTASLPSQELDQGIIGPKLTRKGTLSKLLPPQRIEARDRLLRHCLYLQEEEILAVGRSFWDESEAATDKEQIAIQSLGFLFLNYKVEYWYFELVEQGRKLLMTSIIVFMFPQSVIQLVAGLVITFLGLVISFTLKPCLQPQLNKLQAACLCIQGATLFYGITVVYESSNSQGQDSASPTIITGFIIFLNTFVIAIPFIQFFIIRRPPHGEQSLAERALEAAAAWLGFEKPLGQRASKATFRRRGSSVHNLNSERKLMVSFSPHGWTRPTPTPVPEAQIDHNLEEVAAAATAGMLNASSRQLQLQLLRESNARSYLLKRSASGRPRSSTGRGSSSGSGSLPRDKSGEDEYLAQGRSGSWDSLSGSGGGIGGWLGRTGGGEMGSRRGMAVSVAAALATHAAESARCCGEDEVEADSPADKLERNRQNELCAGAQEQQGGQNGWGANSSHGCETGWPSEEAAALAIQSPSRAVPELESVGFSSAWWPMMFRPPNLRGGVEFEDLVI